MKKICFYLFLILVPSLAQAQIEFNPDGKYLISCLAAPTGGIVPGQEYPLMYNASATEDSSDALWIIKEEETGKYSIKNASTGKYISYSLVEAQKYVAMSDKLQGNNTLFTFYYQSTHSNIAYWTIQPVANMLQAFDKRSYNAVGPYNLQNANQNQLFAFKLKGGKYIEAPKQPEVPLPTNGIKKYLNSFTLNGMELAYDTGNRIHYFSIPLDQMDTDVTRMIAFANKSGYNYTVKINSQAIQSGTEYTFQKVTAGKTYSIQILNGNQTVATEKLIFTALPIVQLYTNGNFLSSDFSRGKLRVYEGEKELSGELLNAEMRYRGASATHYNKKAFAIKIRNENWESMDRSFFGLRNDNYWILDAAAIDASRIRNRVCTDIWNDFSSAPYHKDQEPGLINGTRGNFVEVFIDDAYWGLYCMTERIDRKQLKLKKYQEETETIRGVLYKSSQWSYPVMMGWIPREGPTPFYQIPEYDNNEEVWEKYEVKYPDMEGGEKIDWKPLFDAVSLAAQGSNRQLKDRITTDFDFPVWLDYYLFMEFILATDNHGKNAYFYTYNIEKERKLGIAPWDMDGVLGIRWNSQQINAKQDYSQWIENQENGQHYLFYRLKELNIGSFNDLLKKRYNQLRFSYFTKEDLIQRFTDYIEMFKITGAADREVERWNNANGIYLSFDKELTYLNKWISDRIDYLDQKWGPLEPPTAVDVVEINSLEVYPNPVRETLYVKNVMPSMPVWIYTETGVCIYQDITSTNSLSIDFSRYSQGRYFLKVGSEGKVVIKR